MERVRLIDDSNNVLEVTSAGQVLLCLSVDSKIREIGKLSVEEGKMTYTKVEKEKDIFRRTNAWSINFSILKNFDVQRVIYITEKAVYSTNKEIINQWGSFLHFKTSGFEKKVYLPKDKWTTRLRVEAPSGSL